MHGVSVKATDSIIGGLINAVINGVIAHYTFKGMSQVPMSLNMITNEEISVWGQAVSLTFGLGIILSVITAKLLIHQINKAHPELQPPLHLPFWSKIVPIALTHAATMFGWFIALAVLWTKYFGEVMVSPTMAAVLVGTFAFVITVIVEVKTKHSVLFKKVSIFE